MRGFLLLFLFSGLLAWSSAQAQRTTLFTEPYASLKEGEDWIHHGLYLEAQRMLRTFLGQPHALPDHLNLFSLERAGLLAAQSAIRAEDPLGERKILEFARSASPDPMGNQALLEAAHYYFQQREYAQAVHFYTMIQTAGLGEQARTELLFRKGYCYFVQKDFTRARQSFALIRDVRNDYYYPVNYYHGMTLFFEGRYEDALVSFRRVEQAPRYSPYIPFIISQILFAQARYEELIRYAEPKVQGSIQNRVELENLIGRAYFELGKYAEALPHLKYYADQGGTLQSTDVYQLGYCYYQTAAYAQAIPQLEQVARQQDAMAQNALFLLGDAHLKLGQKVAARNAFMQASRMSFSTEMAENAALQFAKLSYELGADREAVLALAAIPTRSAQYTEAQQLLGTVLVRTEDLDFALDYLGKADLRTPQLKESYQKVHYAKAAQLVERGEIDFALELVKKSMTNSVDARTTALSTLLLADIYHRLGRYSESISEVNRFQTLSKTVGKLPGEASPAMAHYIQGYNYFKTQKYSQATGFFQDAISAMRKDQFPFQQKQSRNNLLGDALIRTGDCFFKVNKYNEALSHYTEAINGKFGGYHYARFQKALILGLQNKPYDKIVELEQLVADAPQSDYADDALYEMGKTSMDMGRLSEATKPLKKLLSDYGKRSNLANAARLKLGLISYNQGDIQESIRYYRQVLENNPENEERLSALAALEEIYVRDLASPDEYFALLEKSGYKVSDASRDSLSFKAADNHYQSGHYDKAITAYTQYLDRFPQGIHTLQALYRRGESYSVQKRFDLALPDFDAVVQRGPSRFYEDALHKAALIAYNHSRDFTAAMGYYIQLETAARSEQRRFEAQVGVMQAAYRNKRPDEVLRYADKVSQNSLASPAELGQARYYLGKVQFDQEKYAAAIPHFQEVLKHLDNEMAGESHYLAALSHFRLGQRAEARQWCLRSNQHIPGQDFWVAKCIVLLADIFIAEQDLFNARAALEGLLDNYDGDEGIRKEAREKLERISELEKRSSRIAPPGTSDLLDLQED